MATMSNADKRDLEYQREVSTVSIHAAPLVTRGAVVEPKEGSFRKDRNASSQTSSKTKKAVIIKPDSDSDSDSRSRNSSSSSSSSSSDSEEEHKAALRKAESKQKVGSKVDLKTESSARSTTPGDLVLTKQESKKKVGSNLRIPEKTDSSSSSTGLLASDTKLHSKKKGSSKVTLVEPDIKRSVEDDKEEKEIITWEGSLNDRLRRFLNRFPRSEFSW